MTVLPSGGRRQALARACHRAGVLPMLMRARRALKSDLRILAYHRVLESAEPADFSFDRELISASAAGFRQQMQYLREHFEPMSFGEVLSCLDAGRRLPSGAVVVTFDDGYDDNYRVAFPILRELGMSAMFFVSTGHIETGAPYAYDWLVHMVCTTPASLLSAPEVGIERPLGVAAWRQAVAAELLDRLKLLDDRGQEALIRRLEEEWNMPREAGHECCRPMTWDQLREMHRAGMEVGSHGVKHRMLAKLSTDEMTQEVAGSKAALERELGCDVSVLSYPVGGPDAFDAETVLAAQAAGYRMACSYVAGTNGRDIDAALADARFRLRRLPVERQMDDSWFEAMITMPELFSYSSRLRLA